jgi:hypothetical protein
MAESKSRTSEIKSVAIYPKLGIARVGNSTEYYLASEMPGMAPDPAGGYKDGEGRIKKQAVLFRVFGLNENGDVVQELTGTGDVSIEWRVHVANSKAAWYQFNNALDLEGQAIPSAKRNGNYSGTAREQLLINPGKKAISGANQDIALTGGAFFGKPVPLGHLKTDSEGRLIFLGGDGKSASKDGTAPTTFANNDNWHDDVSDGTIRATVTIGGATYEAEPAMVAVTPPNFGPGLFGVVTMYDVVYNLFYGEEARKETVDFTRHIWPILQRTCTTSWVNNGFYMLFGQNSPANFMDPEVLARLADNSPAQKSFRTQVAEWYRSPENRNYEPAKIPAFYGDAFGEYDAVYNVDLPLTPTQHYRMQKWADGDFVFNGSVKDIPLTNTYKCPTYTFAEKVTAPGCGNDLTAVVEAMTYAPYEECLGGPFHPGIELTWPLRNKILWEKPFHLKILAEDEMPQLDYGPLLSPLIALGPGGPLDGSGPGSLTHWLGVPWQTDEASCLSGYDPSLYLTLPSFWAARVPNYVLSNGSFERIKDTSLNIAQRLKHLDYRQDWLRDLGTQYLSKINKMVSRWHELGVVTLKVWPEEGDASQYLPSVYWVETGRKPESEYDPTYEQVLIAEHIGQAEPKHLPLLRAETPKVRKSRPFRRDER